MKATVLHLFLCQSNEIENNLKISNYRFHYIYVLHLCLQEVLETIHPLYVQLFRYMIDWKSSQVRHIQTEDFVSNATSEDKNTVKARVK